MNIFKKAVKVAEIKVNNFLESKIKMNERFDLAEKSLLETIDKCKDAIINAKVYRKRINEDTISKEVLEKIDENIAALEKKFNILVQKRDVLISKKAELLAQYETFSALKDINDIFAQNSFTHDDFDVASVERKCNEEIERLMADIELTEKYINK